MAADLKHLRDLVIVAGHAVRKTDIIVDPESDREWYLQSFQHGEPPFYIEHIRRGVVLAAHNPVAMLVFSGGKTRPPIDRSEAQSYLSIAEHFGWWLNHNRQFREEVGVDRRRVLEECARDSFENLLFSICKFQQETGDYPRNVTVVSWAFKQARFNLHQQAIRFPSHRFRFDALNDPLDMEKAEKGEANAVRDWSATRYGQRSKLLRKREERTRPEDKPLYDTYPPYQDCTDLKGFFDFIAKGRNQGKPYRRTLPWEDQP